MHLRTGSLPATSVSIICSRTLSCCATVCGSCSSVICAKIGLSSCWPILAFTSMKKSRSVRSREDFAVVTISRPTCTCISAANVSMLASRLTRFWKTWALRFWTTIGWKVGVRDFCSRSRSTTNKSVSFSGRWSCIEAAVFQVRAFVQSGCWSVLAKRAWHSNLPNRRAMRRKAMPSNSSWRVSCRDCDASLVSPGCRSLQRRFLSTN